MSGKFSDTVKINAEPSAVWSAITDIRRMSQWMGDPEMAIEVYTDWKINAPILIRGFHHVRFENKGIVLKYEKERVLSYSHLDSVSRLPDSESSYSKLEFLLTPMDNHTTLTLTIENFPTEIIRKHLEFYWRTTLISIKDSVERRGPSKMTRQLPSTN